MVSIQQNIVPTFYKNINTIRDANGATKDTSPSTLLIDNEQSKDFHVVRVKNVNKTQIDNVAADDRNFFILIGNDLQWLDLTAPQIYSKRIAELSEKTTNETDAEIVDIQVICTFLFEHFP